MIDPTDDGLGAGRIDDRQIGGTRLGILDLTLNDVEAVARAARSDGRLKGLGRFPKLARVAGR